MTAVIVGPMQPRAKSKRMLVALQRAVARADLACESLLFLLPPAALWIASKIAALDWPPSLHVRCSTSR